MKKTDQILVTGSCGFIGKHLMKALGKRGRGYDHNINPVFDINDATTLHDSIKAIKPKIIVHLAAVSSRAECARNPELAIKTNIVGTFNVLRFADKYQIPVILASSAATYIPSLSLYGITKDCMERLAEMFDNITIARFYNVYGPGSKSVVNKFIRKISTNQIIRINGNTTRDYIYVDDVVNVLLQLVDAKELPKVIEAGTGRATSLKKLISLIENISGIKAQVIADAPIREIQYSQCKQLKYGKHKISLEQGIRRLI